ncbi:hypothetical protein DAI22_03g289100 [Oryza sativa Japonica Group]|nr:hypothetical protein DAI22_03g289100 [Oryza sativa Japonica Group]
MVAMFGVDLKTLMEIGGKLGVHGIDVHINSSLLRILRFHLVIAGTVGFKPRRCMRYIASLILHLF